MKKVGSLQYEIAGVSAHSLQHEVQTETWLYDYICLSEMFYQVIHCFECVKNWGMAKKASVFG